jgi:hypothetical protein
MMNYAVNYFTSLELEGTLKVRPTLILPSQKRCSSF